MSDFAPTVVRSLVQAVLPLHQKTITSQETLSNVLNCPPPSADPLIKLSSHSTKKLLLHTELPLPPLGADIRKKSQTSKQTSSQGDYSSLPTPYRQRSNKQGKRNPLDPDTNQKYIESPLRHWLIIWRLPYTRFMLKQEDISEEITKSYTGEDILVRQHGRSHAEEK